MKTFEKLLIIQRYINEIVIRKTCFTVPVQFLPFPINPVLQKHLKLPKVFLQFEFEPQSCVISVHSLMSAR